MSLTENFPLRWNEPFDLKPLSLRSDERGDLFEFIRFIDFDIPGEGQAYIFSIHPGKRRGDHYHRIKREWFCCAHGKVDVLITLPDETSFVVELSSATPQILYAGPGTSHALVNLSEQTVVIVSYASTQHDDAAPDTYTKEACPGYRAR